MKKVKFIFTVLAFVVGIAGAVASQYMPSVIPYEYIPGTEEEDPWCKQETHICSPTGAYPCQVSLSSPVLRDGSTGPVTFCGVQLRQNTQPPQ